MTTAPVFQQHRKDAARPACRAGPWRLHSTLVRLLGPALLGLLSSCGTESSENDFPTRPIRVVVPFAPGGSSDTLARVFKKAIDDGGALGVPLVIVNIEGAGGTIGSRRVKNALADGHTILFLHQALLTAKHAGRALYGHEAFEAIAATGESAMVIASSDTRDRGDLARTLSRARDESVALAFGVNLGAPSHFAARQVEARAPGVEIRFVQTGGGAKRFAALRGGHVDLTVFSIDELLRFRDAGVRALAILSEERHELLPDVPTAREQGIDVVSSNLNFWWAPRGTPRDRTEKLTRVLGDALAQDSVRSALEAMRCQPVLLEGEALAGRLERLDLELAALPANTSDELPDLPRAVAIVTSALLALVLVRALARGWRLPKPASRSGLSRACGFGALTIGYVATLSLTPLPFVLVTAVFMIAATHVLRSTRVRGLAWLLVPVVFAAIVHLVFSSILSMELP